MNPEAHISPGLGYHPHHLGVLPNLSINENKKYSLYITSRVTLFDGLNTLFDKDSSVFIIHELQDRYVLDPPTKDTPGGPWIACGVIIKE